MKQKLKNKFNLAYKKIEVTIAAFVLILAYAIFAFSAGNVPVAEATVPFVINFQGKLTKVSDGTNVSNASYAFRFKLYDAATSGTLLWTETFDQPSGACAKLAVTNGVFNSKLGSCASLTSVDFSGGAVYLSVDYAPTGTSYDGEMSPRKQLLSSAFAILANGVNGDGGVRNTISSSTALAIAKAGTDYALQVDTSAGSAVTGLKVTSNAATSGLSLNVISSGTNEDLIVNAKGSGLIKLLTSSTGNLAIGSAGQLTVTNAGILSTSGNISTTGSGTITSAGLLQGQLGLTVTGAAVSLNASSNFAVDIATGTSTGTITLGGTGAQSIQIGSGVGVKTITIGNSNDDTFSLASSGLSVSTGGALTGVASIDTINVSSTALTFTSTAPTISVSTAATNLNIDAGTSGAINIAGTSSGSINFAGGAGSSGCTITTAGALTCDGAGSFSNLSGSSSGTNTGDVTLTAIGATPNANGASLSGQALTLQPANGSFGGVVTTTTQTFAGIKTFTSNVNIGTASSPATATITGGSDNDVTISSTTLTGFIGYTITTANNSAISGGNLVLSAGNGHVSYGADGSDVLLYGGALAGAGRDGDIILAHTGSVVRGRVGISTTAPDKALEINSATGANLRLTYNDADGTAANYADFATTSGGDLTIAPSGSDTAITGNLDVSGTIFASTADAFQVASSGAVTAVGVNSGAGLIQGTLGLTVSGAAVSLNDSSNFGVSIAGGTSTGTITLGGTGASQSIQIGTGIAAKTIAIGNSTDDTFSINSSAFTVSTSGAVTGVTTLSASNQITSTLSTGTAPFVVASTTNVANLNASSLNGATFGSPGSIGSTTPGSGAFTTLTSNGNTTLGTGSSLTNTFGSGASSINTIGSATTPGTLTLLGSTIVAGSANTTAFTLGNVTTNPTLSLLGTGLTTLGGNLTVTGTAWTATPTISGLITATSGLTSNGTLTVSGGQNLTMASGSGVFAQTSTGTTTSPRTLSATALTTGVAEAFTLGSALTTGGAYSVTGASYNPGAGNTGNLANLAFTHAAGAASTSTVNGLNIAFTNNSANTTGTSTTTGINIAPTNTSSGAGGTRNTYGINIQDSAGAIGAGGASNSYGIKIGNQGASGPENAYGLYVDTQTVNASPNFGVYVNTPSSLSYGYFVNSLNAASASTAYGAASLAGPSNGIVIGTQTVSGSTAFTGKYLSLGSGSNSYTSGASLTETGRYIFTSRYNVVNNTSGATALTVSGNLADLSSNCTISDGGAGGADTCTDTGKILNLTQSYASASGDVLAIANSGTGKDISGTSNTWNVSKAGAAVFVGVNSGTGLIQGTLGLTVTGATVSLNDSSNFGVSIAGGSSTGTITLGGTATQAIDIGAGVAAKTITIGNANDDTFSINSSGLDVSTGGALSGITGYTQGSGTMSLTSANTTQTTTSSIFALTGNSLTSGTGAYLSSNSITGGSLVNLNQLTSTFAGTGLLMNFANTAGTFSGNFADFQSNSVSKFSVASTGAITSATLATGGAAQCLQATSAGLIQLTGSACGAGAPTWNSIIVPTGDLTLAMDSDLTTFNWDTLTTQNAWTMGSTSITTGKLLNVASTSNAYTTGNISNVSLTQAAATGTSVSGDISSVAFNPTYSTAITTPTISGNTLNIGRTAVTNTSFVSTLTVSGALARFSDTSTQTTGTLTSTANAVEILQNYTSNSGSALNVTTAGTGSSIRINDDGTLTDSTPVLVDASGQLAVGNTSPGALLGVGSSAQLTVNTSGTLSTSGNISTTGSGTISSAGLLTGSAGLTVSGAAANINASGTNLTNIGNSTGVLTVASGGSSGWTNTSGNLAFATATSGNITLAPASTGSVQITSGVATGTGTTSGLSLVANSLTTGQGMSVSSSTLQSGSLVDFTVIGTAAASNTQKALNVSTSGANGTASQTTYGGYFSNTHTGTTSTNYGMYSTATSGTTNIALKAGSTGGTDTYDLYAGIGTAAVGTNSHTGAYIDARNFYASTTTIKGINVQAGVQNFSSGATTVTGIQVDAGAYNNGGTVATAYGIDASLGAYNSASITTGSIIRAYAADSGAATYGTLYGLNMSNWSTLSATTTYGIYMDTSIDQGATRYALYSSSTSSSYLAGNLSIGSTTFTSPLNVGTAAQFQVSSAGAVTAVGVNSGAGLIQGTLGLTITGAVVSLNDSSNFGVSIAGGTSTGTITFGGTGAQSIQIGSGVGVKTITIGNSNDDTFSLASSGLNVTSGGAITGASGIVSSGTIQFSALTSNGPLYTSAGNGTLTTTAPTSGAIGYWSRTGTVLSQTTSNDTVSIANSTTTGADLALTNTGIYTGTGIFNLTANSATTGTLASITGNGLTTGKLLDLQSNGTAAGASQTGLNILLAGANGTGGLTTYGAQISNTHSTNTSTNVALQLTATGGATANYALITNGGNVGIGDTTPDSLFTVGSGDLFQINSAGQIASQQAPQGDYLFALAGTTANDNSRIIDITQLDDSNQSSYGVYLLNTPSLTLSTSTRIMAGWYQALTPTLVHGTSSGTTTAQIYGTANDISLSNLTMTSSVGTSSINNIYGNSVNISGTPTITDISAAGANYLNEYGTYNNITTVPTWSGATDTLVYASYGGYFNNAANTAGNALLTSTVTGVYGAATGNLTTTGTTAHYGGRFTVSGTANDNYGLYVDSSAATNNYGLYINSGTNYMADDLYVGDTAETLSNTGFALDGDDVFIADKLGVEGSIYSDTSLIVGASTTYANGSISQSSGETLTIGTTSANLTLQTTTAGDILINAGGSDTIELQDNTNITGVVTVSSILQVGSATATTYSRLGTATTTHSGDVGAADDLLVTGALEVDGNGFFDGNLTVTGTCTGCGGGSFSGEVDDATNDSLTFTSDDASAPAGTVNSIFRDNTGDLNINTISGKTLNLQIAGTDEYNFSSTALAMNSNNITGVGTAITATAGVTLSSTSANLALTTGTSGNITLAPASTGSVQITSGVTTGTTTSSGLSLVSNSVNSGTGAYISTTALTSGNSLQIQGSGATMTTGGELIDLVLGANTVGAGLTITSTGAYTGVGAADGLINVVANSLSTGYGSQYSFTGLSSGTGLLITGGTSMTTNGELVDLNMGAATAGNGINIRTTGVYTGTGLSVITANSATTGTIQAISATGLTSGFVNNITMGTVLTTGGAISVSGASYNHTGAETGKLISLAYTDASSNSSPNSSITMGLSLIPTINTTASDGVKSIYGIDVSPVFTACGTTGGTCVYHGIQSTTGSRTQTTTNDFTMNAFSVSTPGALVQNTAAGTLAWNGLNIIMPNITQTTGTVTSTGIKITGGTVTSGTSYALTTDVNAGNVGIGTTGPDRKLDVLDASNPQLRLTQADGSVYADLQNTATANLIVTGDTLTSSSAKEYGVQISSTINQTSSASYTGLEVNVTETAATTLNGLNRLADFRVGGSSKFAVRNDGSLTLQDASGITTPYGGIGSFQNHLVRSEEFDNASWVKTSVTAPTANNQVAPDGSTTAESLATSGSGGDVCQWSGTAAASDTFTFSVWAKSTSGTQNFDLRVDAGATSCATANNVTGTAVTHTATTSWQRFTVTQTFSSATGNVKARIFPGTTGGTGTIYAWGAQLDKASIPSTYVLTTGGALTNANKGMVLESNFATASGFTYGARHVTTLAGAISASSSTVGQLIRVIDNATGTDDTATVRGLEVQSYSGTNINGVNTAIAGFGYTFGVHAVTTAQANESAQPAAVFADLDNGSAPTQGNAIRAYSNDATSADLVSIYQETSSYSGNALEININGTFTGNFADFQTSSTTKFKVDKDGNAFATLNTGNSERLCWDGTGGTAEEIFDCTGTPGDLAENFGTADTSISAGDVVVSAGEASSEIKDSNFTTKAFIAKSTGSYQTSLLGVVSTQPNEVYADDLFTESENPRPVALVGRVPVKVTLENGVIKPGDYLTSSATQPGKAMKAIRSGVVIGQALSSYDGSGEASVIVFVNTGFQSIGNTIVLDAPTTNSITLQSDNQNLASNTASTLVIQQQTTTGDAGDAPVANILQLQTGDSNRFMVSSTGSTSILSSMTCELNTNDCPSVLKIAQGNTELFNVDARGTLAIAGVVLIKDDTFAGSVATHPDGTAEITFSYNLGTGKPVVQLTAEAQIPVFAQIIEFKKDDNGNYTGFVMKTFDLISGPVQAIVHYTVVGKQSGYITLGDVTVPDVGFAGDGAGLIIEGGEVLGGSTNDPGGLDESLPPLNPDDIIGIVPNGDSGLTQ